MQCLVAMEKCVTCVRCSIFVTVCIFLLAKIMNNTQKPNCDFDLFSEEDEGEDQGGMSSGEESELETHNEFLR